MATRDASTGLVPVTGRIRFHDNVTDQNVCTALGALPLPDDTLSVHDQRVIDSGLADVLPWHQQAGVMVRAFGWGMLHHLTGVELADHEPWPVMEISGVYGDWTYREDVEASIRALAPLLVPGSVVFVPYLERDALAGEAIRWGYGPEVEWVKVHAVREWADEQGWTVGND